MLGLSPCQIRKLPLPLASEPPAMSRSRGKPKPVGKHKKQKSAPEEVKQVWPCRPQRLPPA
jgi:hypothetical protein